MRVLQICAAYKPAFIYGGPTMSVSMLSENLAKTGLATEVYATTANGNEELPVQADIPVNVDGVTVTYFKRITKDHSHFSPALFRKLKEEVQHFDLVHIHGWWNLVSMFSCLIATKRGVPVLLSPRGMLSPYSFQNKSIGVKWLLHQALGKGLLKKCNIHATSERESEAVSKVFQPKSTTVIPNFVKLPAKKSLTERVASSHIKLIFFSRIEEKKGLDLLLNALTMVTVTYRLTIAGDGDHEYIQSLKKIAADNQVADKVDWIGFQNENKFEVVNAHDLFVLPSYDENFGNAVIESLGVGTPVLISDQVGLADYVKKSDLGWICRTNPSSIAWEINNIALNGQDDLNRIRKDAPAIIVDDFKEENLVARYINMYQQLIKG